MWAASSLDRLSSKVLLAQFQSYTNVLVLFRKRSFLWAAFSALLLAMIVTPSLAQAFLVNYPGGGSVRWYFDYPRTVTAGQTFTVSATGEHVSGSNPVTPTIRISPQPTPIVTPVSTAPDCNPNSCTFPTMGGSDVQTMRMVFAISSTASPGQTVILKVDTSCTNFNCLFQNVVDLNIQVPGGTTTTATTVTSVSPVTQTSISITTVSPSTTTTSGGLSDNWLLLAGITIVSIVAVGIVALIVVTRRKPPSVGAVGIKPPYMPPSPYSGLKPTGPSQQIKPGGPRVIGKRIEEKK